MGHGHVVSYEDIYISWRIDRHADLGGLPSLAPDNLGLTEFSVFQNFGKVEQDQVRMNDHCRILNYEDLLEDMRI